MKNLKDQKTSKEELELLIEEGEGYQLEFKESVNSDLAKELVAFANASGGRILIGVSDNSQIAGCDLSNRTISQIQDAAESCDPPVAIETGKMGSGIERIRSALSQAKCQEAKVGFSSFFTLEFPRPTFTENAKPNLPKCLDIKLCLVNCINKYSDY